MANKLSVVELIRRIRRQGLAEASRRVALRLYNRLDAGALEFPLLDGDIADSTRLPPAPEVERRSSDEPVIVAWICTPPSRGSGGHTTLFRMVEALEERGHTCIIYLYDRHGGELGRHERVIRDNWPALRAEIRDAMSGVDPADAYVASSWETAHVLASRVTAAGARLYFIQDYEPLFYPRGTLSALAEDSYRFGFVNIALGEMVARNLKRDGLPYVLAPFGCDTSVYSLRDPEQPRAGVVFYSRPGSDRRGYVLGRLALEQFHRRHPEEPVHLYGDAGDDWPIPTVQHNKLPPHELNELYNTAKAGFAISFTNISLVAEELLAAGVVPVVTDAPDVRSDLPNPYVRWARPTPGALADALCAAVEAPDSPAIRAKIAGSVRQGWGPAQEVVATTIVDAARGTL